MTFRIYQDCRSCENSSAPWDVRSHSWDCQWWDVAEDQASDVPETPTGADKETPTTTAAPTQWWVGGSLGTFSRSCTHASDVYLLSDGTKLELSAHSDRWDRKESEPDLAIYLAGAWIPKTIAFHIGWQDYGLPYLPMDQVLAVAQYALATAREGKRVEIGCLGAHGRTGTFVALLELLTMTTPNAKVAIAKVRREHCSKAVESDVQEWYVAAVAAHLTGNPAPSKPVRKTYAPIKATPTKTKTKKGGEKKTKTGGDTK